MEEVEPVYPALHVTEAEEPNVVVVKFRDPLLGLTGLPHSTGEQVTPSQTPLDKHAIESADAINPESQVTDAENP